MLNKTSQFADIPFFMSKNQFTGDINLIKDSNAIKQALKNIVLTIKRERRFNYQFGGNPRNFLFDPVDPISVMECKYLIANAINTYEPRVSLKDIGIQLSPLNPNKINIVVVYNVVSSGATDTISISLERTR